MESIPGKPESGTGPPKLWGVTNFLTFSLMLVPSLWDLPPQENKFIKFPAGVPYVGFALSLTDAWMTQYASGFVTCEGLRQQWQQRQGCRDFGLNKISLFLFFTVRGWGIPSPPLPSPAYSKRLPENPGSAVPAPCLRVPAALSAVSGARN